MIGRRPNWEKLLAEFLESRRDRLFLWGSHDCALFTCDAIEAMTGEDLARAARGKYDGPNGAAAFLEDETGGGGLDSYVSMVATRNGLEEVGLKLARRGDVMLWNHPRTGPALGIVGLDGTHALFARAGKGFERWPVLRCTRAWRVP